MSMSELAVRNAAAVLAVTAARELSLDRIAKIHPDDADRIHEAILTADMHFEWAHSWSPKRARTVRVVAVVGSPVLVPMLAVMYLARVIGAGVRRTLGVIRGEG